MCDDNKKETECCGACTGSGVPVNEGLSFSRALELLKQGQKVAREGWNGKGMFLFLVPGSVFKVNRPPLLGIYEEGTEINYNSHIDMKMEDNSIMTWTASNNDMLIEDWFLLIEEEGETK